MRNLALAIALAVSACTNPALPGPAVVANVTTLDESAALAAERAYQNIARLMLATGAAKLQAVKDADRRAYAVVKAVRAAYDAGNASTYAAATKQAESVLGNLLNAAKGN